MHFHRMAVYPECTWLFFACLCQLVSVGGSFLQPCEPINETISVEKDGCPTCLVLQTSICSGHCITKDPSYKSPLSTVYQRVCTYRDVRYETVRLPDCHPGVDPLVTFPVALSCDCSLCTMDTSDCSIHSLKPDFCISQRAVLTS